MSPLRNFNFNFPVGKPKYFTKLIAEMKSPCPNTSDSRHASQSVRNYDFHRRMADPNYQRRLLDIVNNRLDNVCHSWFLPKQRRTVASETAKLSDSTYQIVSQSKPGVLYVADIAVGVLFQ